MRDINGQMCEPQIDMKEKLCTRKEKKKRASSHVWNVCDEVSLNKSYDSLKKSYN